MLFRKKILLFLSGLLMLISLSGCQFFFEAESDALARLLGACPLGEARFVREMCVEDSCQSLNSLCKLIESNWYNARKGFFEITEIERNRESGRSLVFVSLQQGPQESDGRLSLAFEMERTKLRWYIYRIEGIEEFLRRAERSRGIL